VERLEVVLQAKTKEDSLRRRGWDPGVVTGWIRDQLANDESIVGPLPAGWDVNQLNLEQVKVILANKLDNNLAAPGWSVGDLSDAKRLKEVLTTEEHHPNSPLGKRYKELGGDQALAEVPKVNAALQTTLATGDPSSWPSKLKALEDCLVKLKELGATVRNQDL